ncbi:hypothetical protein DL98DRAFT_539040 [Cadophora sp. DSE1049]|nr:hypothetical protein DL98DRAFT_539040 [Cadophora sp. DSE1049]
MSPATHTTSVSSATTSLLALTTPFIPPPGCESHWSLTSSRTTGVHDYSKPYASMVSALVSETVSSCFPSGWDRAVPESRLHFSPAVCPSGMVYNSMHDPINLGLSTTAWCCNSGFSFQVHYKTDPTSDTVLPYNRCFRTTSGSALHTETITKWELTLSGTLSSSELPTELITSWESKPSMRARNFNTSNTITGIDMTLMIHEAWGVTWAASDRSTMSPQLPDMTSWMLIPTWMAGDVIPDGMYDTEANHDGGYKGLITLIAVVGVLVLLAIIAVVCICGCTGNECGRNKLETKRFRAGLERPSAPEVPEAPAAPGVLK